MITIALSIRNGLLAEAITAALQSSGEFTPVPVSSDRGRGELSALFAGVNADIVLMEVSYAPGITLECRLRQVRELREKAPEMKLVLLCDENSAPDIARAVMLAKKDGLIDGFFYSSVTAKYIIAALIAL